MGLSGFITPDSTTCFKRKFRWMLGIENVTPEWDKDSGPIFGGGGPGSINVLPPKKGARPSIMFKDMEAQHLSETVFFPGKAEWKPVSLTLWEPKTTSDHPVFEWIREMYRPDRNSGLNIWRPSVGNTNSDGSTTGLGLKRNATLTMLNGCGEVIEQWRYEHSYPHSVNFGELDMGSSDIVTAEITLRYDRAYIL